jgi:predicted enzyme related to lactoylglutathione lyase
MATVAETTNIANWFEIPVIDLDWASRFYEKVFDVKLSTPEELGNMKIAMFPYAEEGRGAAGSLTKGESYALSHAGTVVYFSLEDILETLRRVNANGGKTLLPKTPIGDYGYIAQFEDTEENRVAIHAMK